MFVAEPVSDNLRELWTVRSAAGSVPTRLIRHAPERNLQDCSWSPDGTRIAYVAYTTPPPDFDFDLYMVSVDGDSITALLTDPDSGLGNPRWSPDGARLAFSSRRTGNGEVWVLTVDTGELVQLTNDPGFDTSPTWSPEGDRIAFASDRTGAFEIWTMSPTGKDLTQVTFDELGAFDLAWSPDGSQIAFARIQNGGSDIWVLELE